MRVYTYVGDRDLLRLLDRPTDRARITSSTALADWLRSAGYPRLRRVAVTVTYTVDPEWQLWIADQHSEHVVCARGDAVLAAGELTVTEENGQSVVTAITNQSTGYCPEPESWEVVTAVLSTLGLAHPEGFTHACVFRRCPVCQTLNLVKEQIFRCAVCDSPLSVMWNCD